MRYAGSQKEKTRERILLAAVAHLRNAGIDGLGVAATMSSAGLTHGGFYAHFASREELLVEAVERLCSEEMTRLADQSSGGKSGFALERLIDACLLSRDEGGTPLAPTTLLAVDPEQLPMGARRAVAAAVGRLIALIEELLNSCGVTGGREEAESAVSEMVGAVAIAKALPDVAAAAEVLRASRNTLKRRLCPRAPR